MRPSTIVYEAVRLGRLKGIEAVSAVVRMTCSTAETASAVRSRRGGSSSLKTSSSRRTGESADWSAR